MDVRCGVERCKVLAQTAEIEISLNATQQMICGHVLSRLNE